MYSYFLMTNYQKYGYLKASSRYRNDLKEAQLALIDCITMSNFQREKIRRLESEVIALRKQVTDLLRDRPTAFDLKLVNSLPPRRRLDVD